jgi:hypothetical protein
MHGSGIGGHASGGSTSLSCQTNHQEWKKEKEKKNWGKPTTVAFLWGPIFLPTPFFEFHDLI